MAEVEIEACSKFKKLDLCREDFSSWTWAESEVLLKDNITAVSGLKYQDFRKFLDKLKNGKDNKLEDGIGGLFRIRWNPEEEYTFSSRTGTVSVAYGFKASIASLLTITSCPSDILYIVDYAKARCEKEKPFEERLFPSRALPFPNLFE